MTFLNKDSQTLFLYRNAGKEDMHDGWYLPPGGHTQRGETGLECAVREFKEETDLELINPRLRVITTFYNEGRLLGGKKNAEDWCVEVYDADDYTGTLKAEHEKAQPVWVPDEKLSSLKMYPGDRMVYNLMKEKGVWQALIQYNGEEMIRFDAKRVY